MADVSKNPLVKGASGSFGDDFAYRTRGNKTHIVRLPDKNPKRIVTPEQKRTNEQFTAAVNFARLAVADPKLKKLYQKKVAEGNTAYNIAFKDFMKPPEVKKIDATKYTGAGSLVTIKAKDDFRVVRVEVKICNGDGVLMEEGEAMLEPFYRKTWLYKVLQDNLSGCILTATAFDIPGNKGTLENIL